VKEILDTVILIMFVIMVAMFIINFNRQQIKKHTDKIAENENKNSNKDRIDE
jgi:preprotein translocase subunit YajC